MDEIVNKVAQSGIITLELDQWAPKDRIESIDISTVLFQGMVLREKDFRAWIKEKNWGEFQGKWVAVHCSADAIIPHWAWMLIASALTTHQAIGFFGTPAAALEARWKSIIHGIDIAPYENSRVVVKGCGGEAMPESVYAEVTMRLQPVVESIMFGEPCSTVPVYKKA